MKVKTKPIRDGTQPLVQSIMEFLKDKNGNHSLREIVILISLTALILSWIGEQFFKYTMPTHMFYAFTSMVGAGCFGYSIEKNDNITNTNNQEKQEKEK
jgi:hypothetical protein